MKKQEHRETLGFALRIINPKLGAEGCTVKRSSQLSNSGMVKSVKLCVCVADF